MNTIVEGICTFVMGVALVLVIILGAMVHAEAKPLNAYVDFDPKSINGKDSYELTNDPESGLGISVNPADYLPLAEALQKNKDELYIVLDGNRGGSVTSLKYIIQLINESKGKVSIIVHGANYSAAATLACQGNTLLMSQGSSLHFHGAQARIPEGMPVDPSLKAMMVQINNELQTIANDTCVKKGIVSKFFIAEVYRVANSMDPTEEKPLFGVTEKEVNKTINEESRSKNWE